jgi:replicative DNA helicase
MGKTAFALNVAMRSAAMHGVPTAIFSLEMSMGSSCSACCAPGPRWT